MLRPLCLAIAFAFALAWPTSGRAHEPPNEEIRELTEALARAPHDATLLQKRAELWLIEGRPDEAAADLVTARSLGTQADPIRAALLWAEVWRQRGRLDEAEAELDDAVAAGSLAALVTRAGIRGAAGRWADALRDYEAALARRPTVELALGRGRSLEALGRWSEAAEGYRQDIGRLGGATVLRLARVTALRRLHRWGDALREVDALLARSAAKTRWLLLRGTVLQEAGRQGEARSTWELALRESERVLARRRSLAARLLHGQVLLALGRHAEARRELVRVRSASPRLAATASELLDAMEGNR